MEITLTTVAAIVVLIFGALVGFFAGFRFADYLNDRQKLRAYFREREPAYREHEKDRGAAAGIAMGVILPALVFLTFRVAAVLADV
jgi:membrane protein DedA with SNARE-associated domain